LLLAVPLLKAIRERQPGSELWLLCRAGLGELALRGGLADRAIEVDKRAGRAGWAKARAEILPASFDRVYCAHQSPRTAFFVARIDAEKKIGFRARWNWPFFDKRIERPMRLPDALRQLALLAPEDERLASRLSDYERSHAPGGLPLSAEISAFSLHPHAGDRGPEARPTRETLRLPAPPDWAAMVVPALRSVREGSIAPSAATLERAQELGLGAPAKASGFGGGPGLTNGRGAGRSPAQRPTAFIAPGSVWPTKMWAAEGFAEVARALLARGWNVILFGASGEREIAEKVQSLAPGCRSAVAAGLSFYESCELLALGDVLASNDSGAMHMAALSGLPTVAAFGPTTLDLGYRPWSASAAVAQRDLPCRPCGKHGAERCPINSHACMAGLSPATVLGAIEAIAPSG
jgi:heptosyltransferase-2